MRNSKVTQNIYVEVQVKEQESQLYVLKNKLQLIKLAELVKTGKLGLARIVKTSIKTSDTATMTNGYQTTIIIKEAA